MSEIMDFPCNFDNGGGVPEEVCKKYDLKFPDCYKESDGIKKIALGIKEIENANYVMLPFCHTVEAEALGALVKLGDETAGPRISEYNFKELSELLNLKGMDFNKKRIYENLKAARDLTDAGENVIYMMSGVISILGGLVDLTKVFKALRKDKETLEKLYLFIGEELLKYADEIEKTGVRIINYADSAISVKMVGDKIYKELMENFTAPFLRKLSDKGFTVSLCPKTAFGLIGANLADFRDVEIEGNENFANSLVKLKGKIKFAGENCIKNKNYIPKGGVIKELVFL